MIAPPNSAFLLAAGLGTRLRPYTDHCPKPMVPVAGRPIIDRALDALGQAGVDRVAINLHYRADQLADHLTRRDAPVIHLIREGVLQDTGGGILPALGIIGNDPFYILNGDALWQDGPNEPALTRLAQVFDPEKMDIVILLQSLASMRLTSGAGDYDLDLDGRAVRSLDKTGSAMFTGIRIAHPRIFDQAPQTPFSFLTLMDRAQAQGRLFGLLHDGEWHHVSTPEDLHRIDAHFREREGQGPQE